MKILIVGMGKMGERYFETVKKAWPDSFIVTIDPKNEIKSSQHLHDLSSMKERNFDLSIDARPNINRKDFLEKLLDIGTKNLVIEKPSASNLKEAEEMVVIQEKVSSEVNIMVPFYRRFSNLYKKSTLNSFSQITDINFVSGAIGIGCNGVHLIDLANYLLGDAQPEKVFSFINKNKIPSPRGSNFNDYGGLIGIQYPQATVSLNLSANHQNGITTQLNFTNGKILIKEQQNPSWDWYKLKDEHLELPIYRTHLETLDASPFPYELNLLELMQEGLKSLVAGESVPNLAHSYRVLKIINMAFESSSQNRAIGWDEELPLTDFDFT